ncbi:hypothetical protein HNR46_002255 [Haloferula luteola]|uniref:Activator of Hsp90 ATPase homologue 1/2-like C-terminal domain-containing protein n=1 Tax=Haloferula luteola TaxID=595692 RepID=A0A840V8U7_9BACT|nr:SRPBCC domain-containing protein [Haloferula luteola]MBB5352014.1 hypothetical protein [Haloferula luteola]
MSLFNQSRTFPYPPEEVFESIRRPELLAAWWGPEGFTNTFDVFEFRPGGLWVFTMHGPDGRDYPNESKFLEIEEPSRVRLRHTVLPIFELTLSLESVPGGTEITWEAEFENEEFAEQMRDFLETANRQNLDRWAEVLLQFYGPPEESAN